MWPAELMASSLAVVLWGLFNCEYTQRARPSVARPNAPFSQQRTSQVICAHQRLDGARVGRWTRCPLPERRFPAMVAAGAGCQAAALVVVDSWAAASTAVARHKVLHRVAGIWSDICKQRRWWQVVKSFPRALTAGGRAMEPAVSRAAAASKTPMVSAAACPLHARVFQAFALGVSHGWSAPLHSSMPFMPIGHPHIVWKLSASCTRWLACARAYSSRCPRAFREAAPVPHGGWSRSWCQNACVVQPERARSA